MKEWSALIVAVVAVIGAAIGAAVSSWLGGRQAVSQDTREHRLASYPSVWSRTSVVSRWPKTTARFENLCDLHTDLRTWYYTIGGLYLPPTRPSSTRLVSLCASSSFIAFTLTSRNASR